MTTFIETPRFPDGIAYGSQMGFTYNTWVVTLNSGHEQRQVNWADARGMFTIEGSNLTETQKDTFRDFFRTVKGRAIGFRIRDWSDYEATTATGVLGTGVGDGTPTYQLGKEYAFGAETYTRPIRKPTAGTVSVYRNAVLATAGVAAGNYALDTTTGIVTFVADATSSASSVTAGATTEVVLAANPGTLVAGEKLYLDGFAGDDAALVNGIAHTIDSISGTGPYTFTLATDTAGATITLGTGTGYAYPQAGDALTWAGEFDVPARFDVDQIACSLVSRSGGRLIYNFGTVPVVEIRT